MGEMGAEYLMDWSKVQGDAEEKILVLVRLRPLSEKETLQKEVADWECINKTTILYRNSLQERSGLPKAYSFDRVFRGDNTTFEVYNEGVKDIALSVVGGINSTIFAYGQTSSGKTYTMNGITEHTVSDIYEYMKKHEEREFVLKFSAIEIYNEVVRDLLNADNTALRLLDDPEKGTIIEKLTEETLRDWNHLKKLLSICEAQRQIAETLLNEASSRSHQILRLTIESLAREFMGNSNSTTLAASVNFVDLAGSERASQALSGGQRLKEGCHINRSLLTLGTVIRKLSKGRYGHVNYRDSKLTRILQPALGGNARTAIICTLSPARSHVEQSRNTLLFATCAKEVSTNAQVNVVMTDKALVKHLQKEVARLESELRISGPTCDHAALLRKKDMQIEKLEKENRELKKQLEIAQSRNDELFNAIEDYRSALAGNGVQIADGEAFSSNGVSGPLVPENEHDNHSSESASEHGQEMVSPEVQCIDTDEPNRGKSYESFSPSTSYSEAYTPNHAVKSFASSAGNDSSYGETEQRIQGFRNLDSLGSTDLNSLSFQSSTASMCLNIRRSRSCRANLMITGTPDSEMADQNEATPPTILEQSFTGRINGAFSRKQWKLPPVIYGADGSRITRIDSQSSGYCSFVDATVEHEGSATHWDEEIPTLGSFVTELKELAKTEYDNQSEPLVQLKEALDEESSKDLDLNSWPARFDTLRGQIIELWQSCNVSLVHRTYFFLVIKKEISYSIYLEVEHRRLSFLKETFSQGHSAQQDGQILTHSSSKKALQREREMLSRLMLKRYTREERIRLYEEWGIPVSSKRRRLQLARRLWTDAGSLYHVAKSAAIVAKLIGFLENGRTVEEMLGLKFSPAAPFVRRSFRWKDSVSSLL